MTKKSSIMTQKNTNVRTCPYKQCIRDGSKPLHVTQSIFLMVAYLTLASAAREGFTPVAVILYICPPMIDLCFAKFDVKLFWVLKCILLTYTVAIVILCFMTLSGTWVDNGVSYTVNPDALVYQDLHISKIIVAYSLVVVAGIPLFLGCSKPESADSSFAKNYNELVTNNMFKRR